MSNYSIERNNEAIENIDLAITNYESAISEIGKDNINIQSKEIINNIKLEIEKLRKLKEKIMVLNNNITSELNKKKDEEDE